MTLPRNHTSMAGELSTPTPTAPARHDHPLSASNYPTLTRHPSPSPNQPPDYFSATSSTSYTSHDRRKANATDADLLGVGPSRRLAPVKGSSSQPLSSSVPPPANSLPMQTSRSKRPWKMFLQSLSREELAVVDTDFDGMTEQQLRAYLRSFSTSSTPTDIASEDLTPEDSIPPTPPIPIQPRPSDDAPLFPPSPPGTTHREIVDHPLRILSRAVRELREAVEKLEEENEALRLIKEAGGVRPKRNRQADQVSYSRYTRTVVKEGAEDEISIHEGLTEALSTSLAPDVSSLYAGNASHSIRDAASVRSKSPAPSSRRAQSPTPSTRTVPAISSSPAAGSSLYSVKSAEPPPIGSSKRNQGNRSSWTSGLWVWSNASKPKSTRPRKGSVGSVLSNAGTLGDVSEAVSDGPDSAEDDEAWRKGDGGSSPAFKAIFLATVRPFRLWTYSTELIS
jgi:hypothetical protein